MLEKFDTNKDGSLDDNEREAMKAQHEAHREEMLQRFDSDKDGKLSDSERDAMRSEMRGSRSRQ
jgi:Ca2+-binding EF-hand superfamily protein